jgi:mono/diheme cytochrome c family protein
MFLNGKRPLAADGGTDNQVLNPVMPYYVFHNMKSEDADAIVAYLRTVPGVNNEIPRRGPSFDVATPATPVDPNKIPLPLADFVDRESALRGRYLAAESGLCIECHTKHQMAADPIDPTKFFAGGEDFSDFFASTLMIHPVSKNLTSDTTTGLGTWTAADVFKALKMGKAKDGSGICPPMPLADYANLTDGDAMDIANYIKSLPPIVNVVADMCMFSPGGPPDGGTEAGMSEAGSDAVSSGDATGN